MSSAAPKFKLLFFGSDTFSIKILDYLFREKLCPIQVVTKWRSQLDKYSSAKQLNRIYWPHGMETIDRTSFNIGLVASFGSLIDETTTNKFRYGLFNVHPSLLPKYRGSTPVQTAILDGVKETGCTVMRIPPIPKFDVGEIVLQEKLSIREMEYAIDLRDRLADLGAVMVEKFLLNFDECLLNMRPQKDQDRSYAKKLKPEQGLLRFKTESLDRIGRKVRAFTGFIDVYMLCLNGLKVKLEGLKDLQEINSNDLDKLIKCMQEQNNVIDTSDEHLPAGSMFFHKKRKILCIKCHDGEWVAFGYATPEYKPRMSALDFYNGFLSKIDQKEHKTDQ